MGGGEVGQGVGMCDRGFHKSVFYLFNSGLQFIFHSSSVRQLSIYSSNGEKLTMFLSSTSVSLELQGRWTGGNKVAGLTTLLSSYTVTVTNILQILATPL